MGKDAIWSLLGLFLRAFPCCFQRRGLAASYLLFSRYRLYALPWADSSAALL